MGEVGGNWKRRMWEAGGNEGKIIIFKNSIKIHDKGDGLSLH